MSNEIPKQSVEEHYGRGKILDAILGALRGMGKDIESLRPADLAPVDEFHIRGREATVELATLAALEPRLRVLDVGCGLGGSVRYLAAEWQCVATGVDLTSEYVGVASALAPLVGLQDLTRFHQASALDLPFGDGAFDVVWTEHAQMNIADKRAFYAEITRVLAPRGRLVFHDIFQGEQQPLHYPVPWAEESAISHLVSPDAARNIIADLGLAIVSWVDKSAQSLQWFTTAVEKVKSTGAPPLGLHLLMGNNAGLKFENMLRNLSEQRIVVIQAVAQKT
jgi:ubiquinone/menaquinone biosynthesis C-methylase UbiE